MSNDYCCVISGKCNSRQYVEIPYNSVLIMPNGFSIKCEKIIEIDSLLCEVTFKLQKLQDEKEKRFYVFNGEQLLQLEVVKINKKSKIVKNIEFKLTTMPRVYLSDEDNYLRIVVHYVQFDGQRILRPKQVSIEL